MKHPYIRSTLSFFGSLFVRVLIAILCGVILLSIVCLIPTSKMDQHLYDSVDLLDSERTHPVLYEWCTSQLDYFTDSLMLMNAATNTQDSALKEAMYASVPSIDSVDNPYNVFILHYRDNVNFSRSGAYTRYWHGYLLFLKPLLFLTDYQGIRLVNTVMQFILFCILIAMMYRRDLKRLIFPYILSILFLLPPALIRSLQYSTCYYLLTIGSILVLAIPAEHQKNSHLIFLYLGISTAFFDFLTYPIATLGIPAVFFYCINRDLSVRDTFCSGVKICFCWAFGYFLMWAGKWIAGSLILDTNILAEASNAIVQRSILNPVPVQGKGYFIDVCWTIYMNLITFFYTPATIILLGAVLFFLSSAIYRLAKRNVTFTQILTILFPYIILSLLPLMWYLIANEHSIVHYPFTNKALVVSVFAGLCGLIQVHYHARKAIH